MKKGKKHYCDGCGRLLGDEEKGYMCFETDDGKEYCSECHWKKIEQEEEEKRLNKFKKYLKGFRDIPFSVYEYCSQLDDTNTVKIALDDLKNYSTACGVVGNKPFTDKVIAFLKKHTGCNFVIAEVDRKEKVIYNMAVHWKNNYEKNSEKFADMVMINGGSLRPELVFESGWDSYESE